MDLQPSIAVAVGGTIRMGRGHDDGEAAEKGCDGKKSVADHPLIGLAASSTMVLDKSAAVQLNTFGVEIYVVALVLRHSSSWKWRTLDVVPERILD